MRARKLLTIPSSPPPRCLATSLAAKINKRLVAANEIVIIYCAHENIFILHTDERRWLEVKAYIYVYVWENTDGGVHGVACLWWFLLLLQPKVEYFFIYVILRLRLNLIKMYEGASWKASLEFLFKV